MNETNSIKQIRIMLLVPGERWPKPGQTRALIYWELHLITHYVGH